MRTYVDYNGSAAELATDTTLPVQWSFRLSGVAAAASTATQGELIRIITGDIAADAITTTRVTNSEVVFGPSFKDVQPPLVGFPK